MTDAASTRRLPARPPLLLAAARAGLCHYRREAVLRRVLGTAVPGADVLARLVEIEERHEAARRAGSGGYSVAAHVEALIARLAETRALAGTEAD
jgi:hypothetical protein